MSAKSVLSQDELDALLVGVESGQVEAGTGLPAASAEILPFDFNDQEYLPRNQLPVLDTIHQRFVRHFTISLYRLLKHTPVMALGEPRLVKYAEYMDSLDMPSAINLVRVDSLVGNLLLTMDASLVFIAVDNYFGGDGRFHSGRVSAEFTPTERRVMQLIIELALDDLGKAWGPVASLEFEFDKLETNPHFVNIATPAELVAVTSIEINLGGGGGVFDLAIPLNMLEPLRDRLEPGMPSMEETGDRSWVKSLQADLLKVKIDMDSVLVEIPKTLGEILSLQPGDVIPIDLDDRVTLRAAGVPLIQGAFGVAKGRNAIKVLGPLSRSGSQEKVQSTGVEYE
ncbi:flagellar motor switch protein FliM [Thiolapillus sp.]